MINSKLIIASENQANQLPDLTDIESLINVLSLCNFCILANVLDCDTYGFPCIPYGQTATPSQLRLRDKYDYNAIDPSQRKYLSYVRGLAKNLIVWIGGHYIITSTESAFDADLAIVFQDDFAGHFLLRQAHAILNYKRQAERRRIRGFYNCGSADVQRQLELLFAEDDLFNKPGIIHFDDPNLSDCDSFTLDNHSWRVTRKTVPDLFEGIYHMQSLHRLSLSNILNCRGGSSHFGYNRR